MMRRPRSARAASIAAALALLALGGPGLANDFDIGPGECKHDCPTPTVPAGLGPGTRTPARPQATAPLTPRDEGDALFRQGRFAEAEAKYLEGLASNRDDCGLHLMLGRALHRQGFAEQAGRAWRFALMAYGCTDVKGNLAGVEGLLQEADDRKKRGEARRQVEFEAAKAKGERALREMGEQTARELLAGLDGLIRDAPAALAPPLSLSFILPGTEAYSKGGVGSAVVDLSDIPIGSLGPVEPAVVRGSVDADTARKRRQADSYLQAAWADHKRADWAAMVRHLRAALKAAPRDATLTRDADHLMLWRDLHVSSVQPPDRRRVLMDAYELAAGDWETALSYGLELAWQHPDDPEYRRAYSFMAGHSDGERPAVPDDLPPVPRSAVSLDPKVAELTGKAMFMHSLGRPPSEYIEPLLEANQLFPGDWTVMDLLDQAEGERVTETCRESLREARR